MGLAVRPGLVSTMASFGSRMDVENLEWQRTASFTATYKLPAVTVESLKTVLKCW